MQKRQNRWWVTVILSVLIIAAVILLLLFRPNCAEIVNEYTITFISRNAEEEGIVHKTIKVKHGENIPFDEVETPQGYELLEDGYVFEYTFTGWYKEGDSEDNLVEGQVTATEDASYIAAYIGTPKGLDSDTFLVRFYDSVTGKLMVPVEGEAVQTVKRGENAVAPTAPEHKGYDYPPEWSHSFEGVTGNLKITARYMPSQYNINKHILGEVETDKEYFNMEMRPASPGDRGMLKFVDWYWTSDFSGEPVSESALMEARDMNVYAKYRIDFAGVVIAHVGGDFEYGGEEETLLLDGMIPDGRLEYSCEWTAVAPDKTTSDKTAGGENGTTFTLCNASGRDIAGEYSVQALVKAKYKSPDGAEVLVSDEITVKQNFSLGKRAVSAEIMRAGSSFTYGTAPDVSINFSGFQYDDSPSLFNDKYVFTYNNGASVLKEKLPVGNYTVSAEIEETDNYSVNIVNANAVSVTVEQKDLIVSLEAEDFVYGEGEVESHFEVSYDSFVYGEGAEPAKIIGNPIYEFTLNNQSYNASAHTYVDAGNYSVRISDFTKKAQNYSVNWQDALTRFQVSKRDVPVSLEVNGEITYGETPEYSINKEQILPEDRELFEFSFSFKYTSADGSSKEITYTPSEKLFPAGSYVVTANCVRSSENYNPVNINGNGATFTIARRQLTVSESVESNYTYGTSVTVMPSFVGFVPGESSDDLKVGQHIYTFKKGGEDYSYNKFSVGKYTVEYKSGYSSNNYDIKAAAPTEFSVNPKDMHVTLVKNEKLNSRNTYGDFTAQDSPYKSVKFAEEDFAFNEKADDIFKNYDKTIKYYKEKAEYTVNGYFDAGEYTVAIAGLVNNNVYENYKVIIELTPFTIHRKTLTINAPEAILETYDGKNYGRNLTDSDINGALSNSDYSISYTYDYLPAQNFESLKKKDESLTDVSFSQAGVYTVKFTVGETNGKNNYNIIYRDGAQSYTVTILRAKGAITGADDLAAQSFDYNGKEHTVNVAGISKAGAGAGELTWSAAIGGAEKQIGAAGEYKFIDVKDGNGLKITITLNETVNCEGDVKYINVTVNKAEYTITQSGASYTYDGTEQGHGVTVSGVLGTTPENVSVMYSNDLKTNGYTFKNAGKHKVDYIVSGNDNYNDKTGNYEIEIKKRDITLVPQVNSSYVFGEFTSEKATIIQTGGSFAPAENLKSAFSGIKCTFKKDGAAYTPKTSYFDVGSYAVAIEGANNENYNITLNNANFSVEKYKFTVGGNEINIRRKAVANGNSVWTYSGGSFFEFSGVVKLKNHNDDSYIADSEDAFNNNFEWESDYKFTVNGVDVTENFEIKYALTVMLTDSAVSVTKPGSGHTYDGSSKQYGIAVSFDDDVTAEECKIEYQIDDNGDWETDIPSFKDVKEGGYKVSYKITSEFFETVTGDYTVTITPKALTVNITSFEGDIYNGQEFGKYTSQTDNVKVEGVINPDKDVYSVSVAEENGKTIKNVGDYTLVYTVTSANKNYSVADFNAKLQITIAPFDLGKITVGESTFTYNGQPHTVTVTPEHTAPAGENPIVLSGKFTVTNVADSNEAFYSVTNKNYVQVESTPVQITVNPATLTVTVSSPENKTYNNEEFSFSENTKNVKVSGFVDGETGYNVKVTEKDGKPIKNAGTYTLVYEVTTDNGNYTVSEYNQECSVTIEKANYIITAGDKEYEYNGSEQGDGIKVSGVNGEKVSPEITYNDNQAVPKFKDVKDGGYSISYVVAMTDNYNQFAGSYKVTITPAALTAEISDKKEDRTYDGTELAISNTDVTVSGIMGSDENVYTVSHEISCSGYEDKEILNEGTYTVTFTVSVSDKNYSISKATLSYKIIIAKATLTYREVTFDEESGRAYDGKEHGPDKIILKTAADADAKLTVELNALEYAQTIDKVKNAGTWQYNFDISGFTNRNFVLGEVIKKPFQESFTISPREVTVECKLTDGKSRGYSPDEETTFSTDDITFTGFLPDDGEPVTKVVKVNGSDENLTVKNADTYHVLYQVTLTNNNYTFKRDKGDESGQILQREFPLTFTIAKATLEELPEGVEAPHIDEVVRRKGRNLNSVCPLNENWKWAGDTDTTAELIEDSYTFTAIYTDPSGNYEPYEYEIAFTTRKEKVTITPPGITLEFDFGTANADAVCANYNIKGEGDRSLSTEELALITKTVLDVDYTIGSTQLANISFTANNDYFELSGKASFENVVVKIKSVEYDGTLYTIEDALNTATSGKTITVKNNTSFATQEIAKIAGYTSPDYYTIKSGVTLLLPYDKNTYYDPNSLGGGGSMSFGNISQRVVDLTISKDLTLINKGTINIGGQTTGKQGISGSTAGKYATITLCDNAKIESNGNIDAYGFIIEETYENGSELIMHKGQLKMPFIVIEHRGGTILFGAYANLQGSPFNQFFLQNVTAKLTVESTATVIGTANLNTSFGNTSKDINLVGNDNTYLIQLQTNSKIEAKFDAREFDTAEKNVHSVTKLDIYGNATLNSLSLSMSMAGVNANLTTKGVYLPLSWRWNVTLKPTGVMSTVTATSQDIKILPGGSLIVEKNVKFNAGKIAVYTDAGFDDTTQAEIAYPNGKGDGHLIVNGSMQAQVVGGLVETAEEGASLEVALANRMNTYEMNSTNGGNINAYADWKTLSHVLKLKTSTGVVAEQLSGKYVSKGANGSFGWECIESGQDGKVRLNIIPEGQSKITASAGSATYNTLGTYYLEPGTTITYTISGATSDGSGLGFGGTYAGGNWSILGTSSVLGNLSTSSSKKNPTVSGKQLVLPESGEVTIYARSWNGNDGASCIVEGTLVTLADGTQKLVEDLLPTDRVLIFNHYTGKYEGCELWSNIHAGNAAEWFTITYLKFSDGTKLGIKFEHGLFDKTLNKYVYITNSNAQQFVGHNFVKVNNVNGEYVSSVVTLMGWENVEEYVRVFSPASLFHMNIVTNGLLTVTAWPCNSSGFENRFEFDENMKYDEEQMQADIEQYGLYTYEDFKDLMTEDLFNALPWKYFKVGVGKGQLTWKDIIYTIEWIYTTGQIQLD